MWLKRCPALPRTSSRSAMKKSAGWRSKCRSSNTASRVRPPRRPTPSRVAGNRRLRGPNTALGLSELFPPPFGGAADSAEGEDVEAVDCAGLGLAGDQRVDQRVRRRFAENAGKGGMAAGERAQRAADAAAYRELCERDDARRAGDADRDGALDPACPQPTDPRLDRRRVEAELRDERHRKTALLGQRQ